MEKLSLASEMLEWEVHALRNVLSVVTSEIILAARHDPSRTLQDLATMCKLQRRRVVISRRIALRSKDYRCRRYCAGNPGEEAESHD
jgi:hypothetical protein